MRGLLVSVALLAALAMTPAVHAEPGADAGLDRQPCDRVIDVLCEDPEGTPGGALCLVAVNGQCLAWI